MGTFDRTDRTVADGQISFDVEVDEVYRGDVGPVVTVRAPYSSATCGLDGIPAGEPVAWFVRSEAGGEVHSDLCTGTTTLTPALTRRLGRVAGPPAPPGPPGSGGPLADDGGGRGSDRATGDRNEDTGGLFHGGLPWWAWTGIWLSAGVALVVVVRSGLRSRS